MIDSLKKNKKKQKTNTLLLFATLAAPSPFLSYRGFPRLFWSPVNCITPSCPSSVTMATDLWPRLWNPWPGCRSARHQGRPLAGSCWAEAAEEGWLWWWRWWWGVGSDGQQQAGRMAGSWGPPWLKGLNRPFSSGLFHLHHCRCVHWGCSLKRCFDTSEYNAQLLSCKELAILHLPVCKSGASQLAKQKDRKR